MVESTALEYVGCYVDMRGIKIILIYLICLLTFVFLWSVFTSLLGANYHKTNLLTNKEFLSFLRFSALLCLPVLPIAVVYTSALPTTTKIKSMWLIVAVLIIVLVGLILFFMNAENNSEGWITLILMMFGGVGAASLMVITLVLSFTSRLNPDNLLRRLLFWLGTLLMLNLLFLTNIV